MAQDSLVIFGDTFTGVTGIKATDSNSGTKTYIRPQGTKSISANGTGIDVTDYASVDVSVSGQSEFAITLTLNNSGLWMPDKTYAQIVSAYNNGDILTLTADYDGNLCPVSIDMSEVASNSHFFYSVFWNDYLEEYTANGHLFYYDVYRMDSSGATLRARDTTTYPPTLTTKTITANGTYNASSDSADGYSSVTVSVSGGASNFVTGTFTGTTTGAAMDVTLNYSGSGWPVACIIYATGGPFPASGDFYDLIQRYAYSAITFIKNNTEAPTYTESGDNNTASYYRSYKSSTSVNVAYSGAVSTGNASYYGFVANNAASKTKAISFKSATTMSVYIASTSYGFAANIPYTYYVIYSS